MSDPAVKPENRASCGGAPSPALVAALSLLQEKWTLFIVYALLSGPAGFNEMSRMAGSVNSTTLAQRLARLEQAGLVHKTVQSTMPPRTSYSLSEAGLALEAVFKEIAAWSERYASAEPPACAEEQDTMDGSRDCS